MNNNKLKGLIAAPFTPFYEDGELNLKTISGYSTLLKKSHVSGVFIGGTTGEGMLMSVAERKSLAEEWLRHAEESFKIIVHVGANSYRDAQELADHARSIGADAVSSMGPLFLRPKRIEDLINYCREVSLSSGDLPFYYYHIPGVSGVDFPMIEFLEKAEDIVPTLKGIKYTHHNLMDLQLCLGASQRKWDILYGQDETLLAGLTFGAIGAVGSTYNYMAPLYHQVIDAYRKGNLDLACHLQNASARFVRHLIRFGGGVEGGKPIMRMIGLDCGPLRTPAHNITQDDYQEFSELIELEGITEYMMV
ncbi:MAG TPA: dihydrodipicolinate synthase family protein [Membranihabitans sp.]|nr:dihydrodipicolinate synthase family protein [Membranihabitans sp.]